MTRASDILEEVNANNREVLYRCRWSESDAKAVVPQLEQLLTHDDTTIVAASLRALSCVATGAFTSSATVARLLVHPDLVVRELAVHTLGRVCLDQPESAVALLAQAAAKSGVHQHIGVQKAALTALINFGSAAADATDVLCDSYESSDAVVRRLAVRGLIAVDAVSPRSEEVLRRAASDTNGRVRKAARRR